LLLDVGKRKIAAVKNVRSSLKSFLPLLVSFQKKRISTNLPNSTESDHQQDPS